MKKWIYKEDKDWAGGGYIQCPHCAYGFSYESYRMLDHNKYCPECGKRVKGIHEKGYKK